jgi:3-deoxy-7-phosphoheptulonate synthase
VPSKFKPPIGGVAVYAPARLGCVNYRLSSSHPRVQKDRRQTICGLSVFKVQSIARKPSMTSARQFLYTRQTSGQASLVQIGQAVFGGGHTPLIAGPCAVESLPQLRQVAETLKKTGISCLRAGAFKPRTSPYAFQGMQEEGLQLLGQVKAEMGLAVVSEVMSVEQVEMAAFVLDCYQIGARNMQNFELLKALGRQSKPVLLKRGLSATLDEFLLAAEYLLSEGNPNVILCERGIRSFDPATRNVLDLASVALLKERTHLPVIVDPSHATGRRSLILPTSRAAIAVGSDGLMIEAHPEPEQSVSDASQAISLAELETLVTQVEAVSLAIGRTAFEPFQCRIA